MKKLRIQIMTAAALLVGLTSCEDWLDVSSTNELDRADLFQTENGYGEALTGVYAKMCDASLYGRELTFNALDIMGSCYTNFSVQMYNHSAWYYYGYGDPTNDYNYDYCMGYIEDVWTNIYTQIANLNSLLETIDGNQGVFSGDNYRIIKGEALGLRAFLHFELLRLFAPAYSIGANEEAIPYVTRLTHLVTPMSTQEEAIDLILNDLDSAKVLLANDPIRIGTSPDPCLASLPSGDYLSSDGIDSWYNRRFRFNYYAAVATMARVYLWKGDNANALTAAQEVIAAQESRFPWVDPDNLTYIGNTSSTSYRNQDRTFATEHIFALNVMNLEDLMDSYIYDGEIGMGNMNQNGLEISAAEWTDVYEGYTADYRYQKWYASYASNMGNDRLLAKFYQNDVTAEYFQERIPLIRLSEMYYIAAECSGSFDYLNEVRNHRGLTSYELSSSNDLEEEILKEYRKEFWGEGQLWYYYKRKSITTFSTNMTDVDLFTWPIPDTEISNAGRE